MGKSKPTLKSREALAGSDLAKIGIKEASSSTNPVSPSKNLALLEVELKYILDYAGHGIRIINKDFTVHRINRAFGQMSGTVPEEAIGKNCWEVFTSPFCHTPDCRLNRVLNGEEALQGEIDRARKDGTSIPCVVTASALRDSYGELIGIIEIFRDLSERKSLERQIHESEESYRALVELGAAAGEAIVMIQDVGSEEGIQVFVNDEWARITGYPKEELLGKSFFDFISLEDRQASLDRHRRKMSGIVVPGVFELNVIRKDGTEVPVELTGAFTTYNGKRANVAYIRDLSQRKAYEKRLKESEERFRGILDNLLEGAILVGYDWRYLYINKTNEKIGRMPIGERLGRTVMEARPGIENTELFQKMRETMERRIANRIQTEFQFVDGNKGWFEFFIEPVPEGIFIYSLDITQSKKDEEALKSYQDGLEEMVRQRTKQLDGEVERRSLAEDKLRSLLDNEKHLRLQVERQLKDRVEFMRILVHELKTPLTALVAASDLLTEAPEPEISKRLIRQVNKGAMDLNKRVNEIFDLARGEIGMLTLRCQEINPDKTLAGTLAYFSADAGMKGISLLADWEAGLPAVWGDNQRITEVLNNLFDNALKYTPHGGRVTLRAFPRENNMVVEVEDTGCGIPENEVGELFKPHRRFSPNNESRDGMGLGLALSKMLVELHGGRIWAERREAGSKFSFTLPLKRMDQNLDMTVG